MAGLLHAAGVTFEQALMELHAPATAKSMVADFKFVNNTDKPITLAKFAKGCSCLSVQISNSKMVYAPGEEGVIRATMEIGNMVGVVDKSMSLWFDQDPEDKPSQTLTVRVHIPVLVKMDVKTLKWTTGGTGDAQKIDLRMEHTKPVYILSATCNSKAFNLQLKALEEGNHYELLVTPVNINEPGMGIIRIETDCDVPNHKIHQAFAIIRREGPVHP
ncbi:MAG: DUF1573 domain-containing protein [Verrucomicrobia bacterium]|nr:DUF1573 domain-containing protein [Verrucomicrobiota bacterium]